VVFAVLLLDGLWIYGGLSAHQDQVSTIITQSVGWPALIVGVGYGARQLADRNERLAQLTTQLEFEQEQRAQQAVTEERLRIARELHDVVAHHMAVVSVQAGLAWYVIDTDRGTARTALDAVMQTSGQAQEEMRRLLQLLRTYPHGSTDDGAPYPAAPDLADIDGLIDRTRAAGLPVDLAIAGTPRPLPPGVGLCAYRIIQEALTNAIKHARGAATTVRLDHGHDRFTASIVNAGVPGPTVPANTPAGHGLIGMRERATLYGGTLTAGPRPDGGYEVVLSLPLPG
jgi:signal transduction histidine kinase